MMPWLLKGMAKDWFEALIRPNEDAQKPPAYFWDELTFWIRQRQHLVVMSTVMTRDKADDVMITSPYMIRDYVILINSDRLSLYSSNAITENTYPFILYFNSTIIHFTCEMAPTGWSQNLCHVFLFTRSLSCQLYKCLNEWHVTWIV